MCGEIVRLRERNKDLEAKAESLVSRQRATCSSCDRPVNRLLDAVVCDRCYEKFLA